MKIPFGHVLSAVLITSILVLSGCELTDPPGLKDYPSILTEDISFQKDILPILNDRCVRCHVGADASEGLRMDTWHNLIAGSDHGSALIAFNGDNSLMINMATQLVGGAHPSEHQADTLRQNEIDFIKRWINAGAFLDDGSVPYENVTELLYVANQNDGLVSIIDTETNNVIRSVDFFALKPSEFSQNSKPHHVVADPGSGSWYVSLIGDNKVSEWRNAGRLKPNFEGVINFKTPGMLALNAATDEVYVGRSLSAVSPPQSLGIITQADRSLREVEVGAPRPHALVVDPAGSFVHTGSLSATRVMTVNAQTDDVDFSVLQAPVSAFLQYAMSPDGNRMVASGQNSNQIVIMNTSAPPLVATLGNIEVGNLPWHPVWTPDGKRVYVGNQGDNSVSVLDMETNTVMQTITGEGLAQPHGASITPDGKYVYISNRNTNGDYTPRYNFGNNQDKGTVVVINTETNQIERVIEVGRLPTGLSPIVSQ